MEIENPTNKYSEGKIYRITDINHTECYIGSTIQKLYVRLCEHRKSYRKHKDGQRLNYTTAVLFDKYGVENCIIELIEDYPCNDKTELTQREGYWIRREDCVNQQIAGRTKKEYAEEHKEEKREYDKLRRQTHKDIIQQQKRDWCERNKEKMKEYYHQYYEANKSTFAEKHKQNYETNRDKILQREKEYRKEHRDHILEYQKKYREEHKESINSYLREKVECPHCRILIGRTCLQRHIRNLHPKLT